MPNRMRMQYFPSALHGAISGGVYTKSESSIDLTTPSASDALSDCDSAKPIRNPYSIEELLKKPEKRMRLSTQLEANDSKFNASLNLSPKKDDCNISVCSASSSSNHSSNGSHNSCAGEDSCDDEQRSPGLNVAANEADDNCEPVEVVN
ncbi:hypothetical protein DOY81_014452 [Sarcophaga bullata]|nr:hypothetical protein DOY81_014452 [Sarcophaga bullata]